MHLDQKISLKGLNTFGMEAEARYFVEAKTHADILTLLNYRNMIFLPVLILGGGSNILFTKSFAGLVIWVNTRGREVIHQDETHIVVRAQSGEPWDDFVRYCVDHGWAGLENLSLIPGRVGAAPIQNIGAYGVEVKETIQRVSYVDITTGGHHHLSGHECRFGYRDSIFKHELKGRFIITEVDFKLQKTGAGLPAPGLRLDYGDLRNELSGMKIVHPTIEDVRNAVIAIRKRKLPDPANLGNGGSFFKNPHLSAELFHFLKERHPDLSGFPDESSGLVKVSAAWLIDQCGWKGYRSGDAGVYEHQPLVLVNHGAATGAEIAELARQIIHSVKEKFDIQLEPEVNIV